MRTMDFMALERVVQEDEKMRYHLLLEPDTDTGGEIWWIRANQGHSMKVFLQISNNFTGTELIAYLSSDR